MEGCRVFLSSPGDVRQERDRAELVIKRLNAERVDRVQLDLIRWEEDYYSATSDFQKQIPKPSECQLVICVFWKRLGTELPPTYARADGTIPTGSEYEFESAMAAAAGRPEKQPDILVYHKTAEVTYSAATVEVERSQYDRFMSFWRQWFYSEKGHFLAGFQSFATADEFEAVLERNLRLWLRNREDHATWTKGSPFRGLEPFDVEHAPIFFGRRKEVERTRARLLTCATAGKSFLLITGASGSGKSSLARAGLIPRLAQVGALSTLGSDLRWAILTPGQIAGDWSAKFATVLFEPKAIGGELALGDFQTPGELKVQFERLDASTAFPVLKALRRAGEAIAAREGRTEAPTVVLLILIDQLEELFAWPKADAEAFLQVLASLVEGPRSPIWIVATMRSDLEYRVADYATFEALTGRTEVKGPGEAERTLALALPAPADLREMIVQPARAAGLTFEASSDGTRDLAALVDVEARPEAMPAVQYLLSELYARRRSDLLTLEAFDALGGVAGVMATRGEEVYRAVDDDARSAFPRVVRALVTKLRADAPPSARRVAQGAFADDPASQRMIGALNAARLIMSDRGELRFTHDSLLTGWKRLQDQIEEEQRLFEARERLEQLCRRWSEARKGGGSTNDLLLQGFQLAEGRELVTKWGRSSLVDRQPDFPDYVAASDSRERRGRRIAQVTAWSVATVFAFLALMSYVQWQRAEAARRDAQSALWVANSGTELAGRRVERAVELAARAFELVPNETNRSALASALFELSPHLQAIFTVPGGAEKSIAWTEPDEIVFVAGRDTQLRAVSPDKTAAGVTASHFPMPWITRDQDGNRALIRAMRTLAPDRLVVILDNGVVALIEGSATAPVFWAPSSPMTLAATAHAAAIGRGGTLIAAATLDAGIAIIACTLPQRRETAPSCEARMLTDVRGRAVAISPDETRVAVADETGALSIYDRSGQRMRESVAVAASPLSLDWASTADWIAVGSEDGGVTVVDVGAADQPVIAKASLGTRPVSTLRWNVNGLDLVMSCLGNAVCLWPGSLGPAGVRFAPIRQLAGHLGSVTRLAWSPAGDRIASASVDGTIRIWSLVQDRNVDFTLYTESAATVWSVSASPDGNTIAAGAEDGAVTIWDVSSGAIRRVVRPSFGTDASALAWTRTGLLAAVHTERGITLVPSDLQRPAQEIAFNTTSVGARIVFLHDDTTVAVPRHDADTIALLELTRPEAPSRELPAVGPGSPFGIAVDRDGKTLFASYTDGGGIRAWDLVTGRPRGPFQTPPGLQDPVGAGSLSLSPDAGWLAASSGDGLVRIYDARKGELWRALQTGSSDLKCVAFNPDGTKLAALGADGRIYVWTLGRDSDELFLQFAFNRSDQVTSNGGRPDAAWLSWVTSDELALASGQAAVTVLGLNSASWRRRVAAIAPPEPNPRPSFWSRIQDSLPWGAPERGVDR